MFLRRQRSWLAIDINDEGVQFLLLKQRQNQKKQIWVDFALPEFANVKAKTILRKMSIKNVVTTLPHRVVTMKFLSIPFCLNESERYEYVRTHVLQYPIYSNQELRFDYEIIGENTGKDNVQVRVVIARISDITQRVKAIENIGLKLKKIDVDSLALEAVIQWIINPQFLKGFLLVVCYEHYRSLLVILKDGFLIEARDDDYKMSEDNECDVIFHRISQFLRFCNSNNPSQPMLSGIALCGTGEYEDHLKKRLKMAFRTNVFTLNLNIKSIRLASVARCMGLALRGFSHDNQFITMERSNHQNKQNTFFDDTHDGNFHNNTIFDDHESDD